MSLLVATSERLLTFQDLEEFPDDGKRREIVGGRLYVSPAPLKQHQRLLKRLTFLFRDEIEMADRGEIFFAPVDVRFSTGEQVQPDLIVLLGESTKRYRGNTVFGPPDIVVEVTSPGTGAYDRVEKARLYEAQGVPEYWQADPLVPEIRLFALRNGRYERVAPESDGRLRSTVVPDLIVDPANLLAGLDD